MFRNGDVPLSGYHEDIYCIAGARTEGKVELLSILAPATQKGRVDVPSLTQDGL